MNAQRLSAREVAERVVGPDIHVRPIVHVDPVSHLPAESLVTAATVEEPLPLLMSGLVLWGFGMTMAAMIPLSLTAFVASPLLIARDVFRRAAP
ncbi:MAG TPA: hypothetical protein VG297_06020 [Bryobacteraceae bacterium]|nr:hypothetical protein [Bryobacteraceae bacterium]